MSSDALPKKVTTAHDQPQFYTQADAKPDVQANSHCSQRPALAPHRYGESPSSQRIGLTGQLTRVIPVAQTLPKTQACREHVNPPTTCDATCWRPEGSVPVGVSRHLLKKIQSGMACVSGATHLLSVPNSYSLRWHHSGDTYLQVKDISIKITKLNGNRFLLDAADQRRRMMLRLKKNTFFIESLRERLKVILTVGLGGRKRKYPVDVLKEQAGFTEESARRLLSQYHFPDNGVYSEYMFALDIEQWGNIPPWAARFKKISRTSALSEGMIETVVVLNPRFALHKLKLRLGEQLGEGGFGEVFLDADDNDYVIKRFFSDNNASPIAEHEAEAFQRYYGELGAQVFYDENHTPYLRMYKVPGVTLNALAPGSLPADAVKRFVDMLERLTRAGIIHGDLNAENILWDAESKTFFPIDIRNIKHDYFTSEWEDKLEMNESGENEWGEIIEALEDKIPPSSSESN